VLREPGQRLLEDLLRLGHVLGLGVVAEELAEGLDRAVNGREILLVGRRQEEDRAGRLLPPGLGALEGGVVDLRAGGVRLDEGVVAVARLGVLLARELHVGQADVGEEGRLAEGNCALTASKWRCASV